jgi:hypothetical protein
VSNFPHKPLSLTAGQCQHPTDPIVIYEDTLVESEEGGTNIGEENKEQQIDVEVEVLILLRVDDHDE